MTVLLAGCSLAPDYQRPEAPVAADWPTGAQPGQAGVQPAADWRAYFTDPALQEMIAAALESNRDLRMAVSRVEEARAQYGIARAARFPGVDLAAGRSAARTPADLSSSPQRVTQRYDVSLSMLSYELDFWGRLASLSDAAKASFLATDEARASFQLSLIADVANAYLTWLEMDERAALARETVAGREEVLKMITKRRDVGIAGDLDYLTAEGALQAARGELANLARQRAAALNALTLLVGKPLGELPAGRRLADVAIVRDVAPGLPSEVLVRRPDVRAAEQRLISANANIGAARAAFLPKIVLTATLGTASAALSGLFDPGSRAWAFQPTLRQPLFQLGLGANLDLAKARKVTAIADYEKTVQQAFREVADLLSARTQLAEQLAAQEAAAKAEGERYRIVDARYQAGIASYLEVLDAQRDLFAAQQGAVAARRALLATAAQLYKALGGGDAEPERESGAR